MVFRRIASILAAASGIFLAARATTIDPLLWQQLAEDSDFIGIVECDIAGGIVARYRIEEVWKGDAQPGASIAIRTPPDHWGPQYPLALVGERFLVTAYRRGSEGPSRMASTTLGGAPIPLWWRRIPADFSLPPFQGSAPLDSAGNNFHRIGFGFEQSTLAAVREQIQRFLALDAEQRAFDTLRAIVEKHQRSWHGVGRTPVFVASVTEAKTHADMLQALITCWDEGGPDQRRAVEYILRQAPATSRTFVAEQLRHDPKQPERSYTVQAGDTLESIGGRPEIQFSAYELLLANADVLQSAHDIRPGMALRIVPRLRLWIVVGMLPRNPLPANASAFDPASAAPTESGLAAARSEFGSHNINGLQFWQAAELLLAHEPDPVINWLCEWTNPAKHWSDAGRGYSLGSWASVKCGRDRAKHLSALLEARDPWIQVVAAIYLEYEDESRGLTALRRFAKLPGEPGIMAALALARRGDRAALDQAIDILRPIDDNVGMQSMPHRVLQQRVVELLSNTAAANGIRFDARQLLQTSDEPHRRAREFLRDHPYIKPYDPWLRMLRMQKID